MAVGTVKWFDGGAGYGCIQPDDDHRPILVSKAAVEAAGLGDLLSGQRVEFEEQRLSSKIVAEKLRLVEAEK